MRRAGVGVVTEATEGSIRKEGSLQPFEFDGGMFEEEMFEGLLDIVFFCLYQLPFQDTSLNPRLVNKRWKSFFKHPLHTFIKGEFNSNLAIFPPSYYATDSNWKKISINGGIVRQLFATPTVDPEREEFLLQEMFLHKMYLPYNHDPIPNTRITEALDDIHIRYLRDYAPDTPHEDWNITAIKKMNTATLAKWAKLFPHCAIVGAPRDLITEEMCVNAILKNGATFRYVPAELKTEEVYKAVVTVTQGDLVHVPDSSRTVGILARAVSLNAANIQTVPIHLITEEMCKSAAILDGYYTDHFNWMIQNIPEEVMTEEVLKLAVKKKGSRIEGIPRKRLTEAIAKNAVRNSGWSLRLVPKNLRTEEVCRIAVANDENAKEFVPMCVVM
eukprot:TRINITY_DN21879_c0_g1_i1.p1 TRINITY_DN21879_c0_g1~~TRINITY_DN21879_c0_g1_i1.p1  ORF type:complete len:386 (-),score=69.21 TRINITY_DN21879_c0_g1_i1:151-1308(-)